MHHPRGAVLTLAGVRFAVLETPGHACDEGRLALAEIDERGQREDARA